MSDMSYSAVGRRHRILDVVDEDWICDRLSDDDIDVPKELVGALIGDEEDEESLMVSQEEQWSDLGLDRFSLEQQPQQVVQGGQGSAAAARGAQLPAAGSDVSA